MFLISKVLMLRISFEIFLMNSKLYVRSMVSDDTPIDIYKKVINAYMYLLSLILSFLKKSIKTVY